MSPSSGDRVNLELGALVWKCHEVRRALQQFMASFCPLLIPPQLSINTTNPDRAMDMDGGSPL
jgi:hypothetical protein